MNLVHRLLLFASRKAGVLKSVLSLFGLRFDPESEIYYISSGESLPPPLPREEETELSIKSEQGDTEARSRLIEHNLRLVVYIAKKFENTGIQIDDLMSIGTIALIKAVNTFRSDKNIKLATYASRCIENEILMFLRKTNRLKLEVSLDEPLNVDWDGNELLLGDVLGTDNDIISRDIEDAVDLNLLNSALARLGERDRRIMILRFGLYGHKEYTQKQVADMLGISQSYFFRLEKRILGTLYDDIVKMQ